MAQNADTQDVLKQLDGLKTTERVGLKRLLVQLVLSQPIGQAEKVQAIIDIDSSEEEILKERYDFLLDLSQKPKDQVNQLKTTLEKNIDRVRLPNKDDGLGKKTVYSESEVSIEAEIREASRNRKRLFTPLKPASFLAYFFKERFKIRQFAKTTGLIHVGITPRALKLNASMVMTRIQNMVTRDILGLQETLVKVLKDGWQHIGIEEYNTIMVLSALLKTSLEAWGAYRTSMTHAEQLRILQGLWGDYLTLFVQSRNKAPCSQLLTAVFRLCHLGQSEMRIALGRLSQFELTIADLLMAIHMVAWRRSFTLQEVVNKTVGNCIANQTWDCLPNIKKDMAEWKKSYKSRLEIVQKALWYGMRLRFIIPIKTSIQGTASPDFDFIRTWGPSGFDSNGPQKPGLWIAEAGHKVYKDYGQLILGPWKSKDGMSYALSNKSLTISVKNLGERVSTLISLGPALNAYDKERNRTLLLQPEKATSLEQQVQSAIEALAENFEILGKLLLDYVCVTGKNLPIELVRKGSKEIGPGIPGEHEILLLPGELQGKSTLEGLLELIRICLMISLYYGKRKFMEPWYQVEKLTQEEANLQSKLQRL